MSRQFISNTALAISHLKQVNDKMTSIREEDLVKLDQTVNTYLQKRKEMKQSIFQQESFEERIRSQLMTLEQKNDYLLKELDIITRNFENEREDIRKANEQWKNEPEEFNEGNLYEQFCKELIQELAPFRKITDYVDKLDNLKRQVGDKYHMTNHAQEFFERVEEIICEDGEQRDHGISLLSDYDFNS